MDYVAKVYVGIGDAKRLAAKSKPGPKENAVEWCAIMNRVLAGQGYEPELYECIIDEI